MNTPPSSRTPSPSPPSSPAAPRAAGPANAAAANGTAQGAPSFPSLDGYLGWLGRLAQASGAAPTLTVDRAVRHTGNQARQNEAPAQQNVAQELSRWDTSGAHQTRRNQNLTGAPRNPVQRSISEMQPMRRTSDHGVEAGEQQRAHPQRSVSELMPRRIPSDHSASESMDNSFSSSMDYDEFAGDDSGSSGHDSSTILASNRRADVRQDVTPEEGDAWVSTQIAQGLSDPQGDESQIDELLYSQDLIARLAQSDAKTSSRAGARTADTEEAKVEIGEEDSKLPARSWGSGIMPIPGERISRTAPVQPQRDPTESSDRSDDPVVITAAPIRSAATASADRPPVPPRHDPTESSDRSDDPAVITSVPGHTLGPVEASEETSDTSDASSVAGGNRNPVSLEIETPATQQPAISAAVVAPRGNIFTNCWQAITNLFRGPQT